MGEKPRIPMMILMAVSLLMVGLLAGCSSDEANLTAASGTGGDDFDRMDFNDTYGGLTATDEEAAFGDDSLKEMMLAEEQDEVNDPLATDPVVLEMEERSRNLNMYEERERPRFTYLRVRWGMLRGPDDTTSVERPCDMTDWTGSLRIDRGIMMVERMIKFEFPNDHVIFPRLDRQTVAFVSHTWCGQDGLWIRIIEPPVDETLGPVTPNKLHIDTAAFTGEFLVDELAVMDEVIEVDDSGNKIQLTGFTLRDIEICPKGFLSGRYRHLRLDRPDSVDIESHAERYGSFAGAWYSLNGRVQGFLRGGYGVNEQGERVFAGKYIDRQGRFRGLLRGGWEPATAEGDLGVFRGKWISRNGLAEGILKGRAHPVEGYPGGFFEGRWTTMCDEEAEGLVL